MEMNLVCCTQVLLQDIGTKRATQKDVALIYALAIKSESAGADRPDWKQINEAILARWSMSGLKRIKDLAWRNLAIASKAA